MNRLALVTERLGKGGRRPKPEHAHAWLTIEKAPVGKLVKLGEFRDPEEIRRLRSYLWLRRNRAGATWRIQSAVEHENGKHSLYARKIEGEQK